MSNSSILGGNPAPAQASGKDIDALGPSDTSDSGSDVQGERAMPTSPDNPGEWGSLVTGTDSDSDASGTGERASADGDAPREDADILPDRIIDDAADPEDSPPGDSTEAGDVEADLDDGDDLEDDASSEGEGKQRGVGR